MRDLVRLVAIATLALFTMAPKCTGDEHTVTHGPYYCSCQRTCDGVMDVFTTSFSTRYTNTVNETAMRACVYSCGADMLATCTECSCTTAPPDAGL